MILTSTPPQSLCMYTCTSCHTAGSNAERHGIRVGDKLLEVNGFSVRGFTHQQAGALFNDSSGGRVSLLVHSIKPAPKPTGTLYSLSLSLSVLA